MNNIKDNQEEKCETVELKIPFAPEYVGTVRLAASSIALKVGFDIDDIEDIKVSISEVCNKFITCGSKKTDSLKIVFKAYSDKISVIFFCEDDSLSCIFDEKADAYAIAIMRALMDEVILCTKNGFIVELSKVLKGANQNAGWRWEQNNK